MIFYIIAIVIEKNFTQGDAEHIEMSLEKDDILFIHSFDPLMSVYLYSTPQCSFKHYIDTQLHSEYADSDKIAFVDFGASVGYIELNAKKKTNISIDVFIFPNECEHTRYIVNYSPVTLLLEKNYSDSRFKISNEQVFCFWPILYNSHEWSLDLDSETDYDTFKLMLNSIDQITFTGQIRKNITYDSQLYWFKWYSDENNISNFVNLSSNLIEQHQFNITYYSNRDNLTSITVLMKNIPGQKIPTTYPGTRSNDSLNKIPFVVFISASLIVILLIIGISIFIFILMRRRRKYNLEMEADIQELMDDFTLASNPQSLPQPVSFN